MATVHELTTFVGDTLGVGAPLALEFAEDLHRCGHIGDAAADATPADAARLVTALMATDLPTNASYAVERFAALPLRWYGAGAYPEQGGERVLEENMPISEGAGPYRNRLSRSFAGALAYLIELATLGKIWPEVLPPRVAVRRSLGRPAATIDVDAAAVGLPPCRMTTFYGLAGDTDELCGMRVMAELPGTALQRIGDFLATRLSSGSKSEEEES